MIVSRNIFFGFALTALAALIGCGAANIPEVAVTPPPPSPVKVMLADVAASGDLGSGAESIREALNAMQATDSVKATSMLAELAELEALEDPEDVKAKAREMADQL